MLNFKKLTYSQKGKIAQKIIDSLDGFSYRDAKDVLSVAVSLLDGRAVVRSSQAVYERGLKNA